MERETSRRDFFGYLVGASALGASVIIGLPNCFERKNNSEDELEDGDFSEKVDSGKELDSESSELIENDVRKVYDLDILLSKTKSFEKNRRSNNIEGIVIHSTEGSGTSAYNTFMNVNNEVSPHYLVMENGRIYQMVDDKDTAWHCGKPGNFSYLGIEFAGFAEKEGYKFSNAQYDNGALLLTHLMREHNLNRRNVVSHKWIGENGLGTKHRDPGPNFDWDELDRYLREYSDSEIRVKNSSK